MSASISSENSRPKTITIVVLLVAIVLMLIGFNNGEHRSYFQKAILVCTQCIGLG